MEFILSDFGVNCFLLLSTYKSIRTAYQNIEMDIKKNNITLRVIFEILSYFNFKIGISTQEPKLSDS